MIAWNTFRAGLVFCCLIAVSLRAEEQLLICHGMSAFAPVDSAEYRKYSPGREIDVRHFTLDVTPDFKTRTVTGKATLQFKPIAKPFPELRLDAVNLTVSAVTATEKILGWQATGKEVIVTFAEPIAPGHEAGVTVSYSVEPKRGLYFRTPEMGYAPDDMNVWSQGEPTEARYWFPCLDTPNTKFTSEMICHVPAGMVALSNGKLVSETPDDATGLVAFRWLQDKPHANYLIALAAGNLKKVEDKHRDVPLALYVPASQIAYADTTFRDTKDIMAFFEQEIGVPYPWAKYYQVCVTDYHWGGMENTTLTILNDRTLFTPEFENVRSSQGLVAHEMAHQWFGDLVTCKDWSHLWLNEGFASYYDALYEGHKHGRDAMLYAMWHNAKAVVGAANDRPMVWRKFGKEEEMFNYLAYPKGSWILHMLRSQLGEDLYRQCIKTYLERHQFGSVVTEDLNKVIEELSGRSFDQFFDQWAYHAAQPDLVVNYSWDERAKLAKVSIQQNQKITEDVPLFQFPLTIRFKSKSGAVDKPITVKERAEDFYFALTDAPESVRVDPHFTLLAKINFNVPNAMLFAQLADTSDGVGRWLAAELLGTKRERAAVTQLRDALNRDAFYGVRLEAAKALRAIHTDEARDALLASVKQDDARVRRSVLEAVQGFFGEPSFGAAQQALAAEKNPDLVATAIGGLGAYPKAEVREQLVRYLNTASFHSVLAEAAIGAMRTQDDPALITPLLAALKEKEPALTATALSQGLVTLGFLARHEEKKDTVREFLTSYLDSKKKRLLNAAIAALGVLGDPKAVAALEKFAGTNQESPERAAAEKAVNDLRAGKKPSVELETLRKEVLTLQQENRDLRKEFQDLKKKLDVAPATKGKPAKK